MLNEALDKIKEIIDIEEFDDTKILIDTDWKFSDNFILKRVVILMVCVIKDRSKFYPWLFLDHALYDE